MTPSERRGYQWIIDPSGHRWKVTGFDGELVSLVDAEGREINVGRLVLQTGLGAQGAWRLDKFERVVEKGA